jgi:outer membrane protein TolC
MLACALLVALIPFPSLAGGTDSAADEAAENKTFTLVFDKIEELVLESSPDVQDNREEYDNSDNGILAQLQLDKANYSVVWQVQSNYFKYNDLKKQLNMAKAKIPVLDYQVSLVKTKQQYGQATWQDVLNAEKAAEDNSNSIKTLEQQMDAILKNLRYHLSLDDDTAVTVEAVPYESVDFAQIDYDQDLYAAAASSYDIRIADWSGDTNKFNKAADQFKSDFESAYNNLKAAIDTDDYNSRYFANDQRTFKLAEIKYQFGLLTKLDYLTAQNTYTGKIISADRGKQDLYKAYIQYQWAKRGLIVN